MAHSLRRPCLAFIGAASLALAGCEGEGEGGVDYSVEEDGRTLAPPKHAPMERCYGIAKAGANDGLTGAERKGADGPGTSSVDYQGNAWTYVERGRCEAYGADGGLELPGDRRGSLEPLKRDRGE
jgi:uncharacterized membrane protein